eukprot:3409923-Amphidinium_carterae.1
MESASDALDFDLYVDEKKREAIALYFKLVVLTDKTALGIVKQIGNQDGFEAIAGWRFSTHQEHLGETSPD